ncbi:MAG: hypothetical protein IJI21_09170 [Clostridia bacterium]|nr:hypothetical protein [Clostridia bacterium]
MNNILAILTALVLMMSGVGTLTQSIPEAVVEEMSFTVNAEAFEVLLDDILALGAAQITDADLKAAVEESAAARKQSTLGTISALAGILNESTVRFTLDKGYLEAGIYTRGETLVNLAAEINDEGIRVASALFGDTVLTLSPEAAKQIMEQGKEELKKLAKEKLQQLPVPSGATGAAGAAGAGLSPEVMSQIDQAALSKAVSDAFTKALSTILGQIGAPETGEFTVDEQAFTVRIPIRVTMNEIKLAAMNALKEILESEAAEPILKSMKEGENVVAKLNEKIAEVQGAEQDQPILAYMYSDAEGKSQYLHVKMHESEKAASFGFGQNRTDGGVTINVFTGVKHGNARVAMKAGMNGFDLKGSVPTNDGRMVDFMATANAKGFQAEAVVPMPTGKNLTATFQVAGTEIRETTSYDGQELFVTTIRALEGEKVERLTGSAAETFDLSTLLNDETGEAVQALTGKLMSGAFTLLGKVMTLLGSDENTAALLQMLPIGMPAAPANPQ